MDDPGDRLASGPARNVGIFQCMGQFLWITQGNFNTADIEYCQDRAGKFPSNGITMIGAYGLRLFGARHLDRMNHLPDILDKDSTERKAVAPACLPQFGHHDKRDEIPCTLNLQYLVRDKKVNAATCMGSQDAYKVLPYDLFMFTMLQEYVAARLSGMCDMGLGTYDHFSGSFHTYRSGEEGISGALSGPAGAGAPMERMPAADVEASLRSMHRFEAALRGAVNFHGKEIRLDAYAEKLDRYAEVPYWRHMGTILPCCGAWKIGDKAGSEGFANGLGPAYRRHVRRFPGTHGGAA